MVRAIHDVKGIDMGNDLVRYKAEVDIDGRQLTRRYLNSQDLERFLEASGVIWSFMLIFSVKLLLSAFLFL